jgi:hypothetical protein
VLKNSSFHIECRLGVEPSGERLCDRVAGRHKPVAAKIRAGEQTVRPRLGQVQGQPTGETVHEIPGIPGQLPLDIVYKTDWTEEEEVLFPSQETPQEKVEPDEMVHVGVRDEYMGDFQEVAWG